VEYSFVSVRAVPLLAVQIQEASREMLRMAWRCTGVRRLRRRPTRGGRLGGGTQQVGLLIPHAWPSLVMVKLAAVHSYSDNESENLQRHCLCAYSDDLCSRPRRECTYSPIIVRNSSPCANAPHSPSPPAAPPVFQFNHMPAPGAPPGCKSSAVRDVEPFGDRPVAAERANLAPGRRSRRPSTESRWT
jgi:hypothetical protein